MKSFIDYEELSKNITKYQFEFAKKEPFRNVVIDDFVDDRMLKKAIQPIKNPTNYFQWNYSNKFEIKHACNDFEKLPSLLVNLIRELNSNPFVEYLEKITRIPNLIPDPKMRGGGLHIIGRGGLLGVHKDFNYHPDLRLKRKINLILYLNDEWLENEYGGHLELWSDGMERCVKKISPVLNRAVIFDTEESLHGHPVPLSCPKDRYRMSIATYFYTQLNDDEKVDFKSTYYEKLPNEKWDKETYELRDKRAKSRI